MEIAFRIVFVLIAGAMLLFFVRKRAVIAEANQDSTEKIFGRRPSDRMASAGGWWNVAIASIIFVAGIVGLVVEIV